MTALARPARSRARPVPSVQRPKLRVLDGTLERRRRRTVVIMLGTVGAVMALLLSVLYLQVVMLQRQRELDDLANQSTEVMRENQDLRRNVAELESPDAIVRRATEELGMVPAPEVVYLDPSPAAAPDEPIVRTLGDQPGAPSADAAVPDDAAAPDDPAASDAPTESGPAEGVSG